MGEGEAGLVRVRKESLTFQTGQSISMTRRRQTLEMASYNAMQKEKEAAETRASL